MAKYIVEGGHPLKGKVKIPGAKNSGFKLMIAALLSDRLSTLHNVPYIRDVISVSNIIRSMGAKVEISDDTIQISGGIDKWEVPEELGMRSRASFMYLPLLLHRFGKGVAPYPVGDKIGNRPINWFLEGLERMGASVEVDSDSIKVSADKKLRGCEYRFPKNSHTGTEALILAACLANGKTSLENSAAEPEVDDLIEFLNKMGAKVKRVAERTIEIVGVQSLQGSVHEVMPDRNEAVTFGCIALGTKGNIEIDPIRERDIKSFLQEVSEAGGGNIVKKGNLNIYYDQPLRPTFVETRPHPAFMTDWQSLWAALMTQSVGESVMHETTFENRFAYVDNLKKIGAKIDFYKLPVSDPKKVYNFEWTEGSSKVPHAIKISGPTTLKGQKLEIADIRAGATLVFAALMAEGVSEIGGVEHIERGYENLEGRLESLGARIKKVD